MPGSCDAAAGGRRSYQGPMVLLHKEKDVTRVLRYHCRKGAILGFCGAAAGGMSCCQGLVVLLQEGKVMLWSHGSTAGEATSKPHGAVAEGRRW